MSDVRPDDPIVYTIQAEWGGPVKVGFCSRYDCLPGRLASLQTASPHPLVVRRVIVADDGVHTERALHARLAQYRMAGEWFAGCPEVAMVTGARIPKPRDEERRLAPLIRTAFEAGISEGERRGEITKRAELKEFFDLASAYFDVDEYPAEDGSALEPVMLRLRKFLGRTAHETAHAKTGNGEIAA